MPDSAYRNVAKMYLMLSNVDLQFDVYKAIVN